MQDGIKGQSDATFDALTRSCGAAVGGVAGNRVLPAVVQMACDDPTLLVYAQRLLRTNGLDVNAKDIYGRTPVAVAVANENTAVLAMLLTAAAVSTDGIDMAALMCALQRGSKGASECVPLLIANGFDVFAPNVAGINGLYAGVKSGDKKLFKYALEKAKAAGRLDDLCDFDRETALTAALQADQYDMVRQLVAAGASTDGQLRNGSLALHHAVANGDGGVFDALYKHVAVDVVDASGRTAARVACESCDVDKLQRLLRRGANATSARAYDHIVARCVSGQVQPAGVCLEMLLKSNASATADRDGGASAATAVAASGRCDLVAHVVANGGTLNDVPTWGPHAGKSGVHIAVERKNVEMARAFVTHGAAVGVRDYDGERALMKVLRKAVADGVDDGVVEMAMVLVEGAAPCAKAAAMRGDGDGAADAADVVRRGIEGAIEAMRATTTAQGKAKGGVGAVAASVWAHVVGAQFGKLSAVGTASVEVLVAAGVHADGLLDRDARSSTGRVDVAASGTTTLWHVAAVNQRMDWLRACHDSDWDGSTANTLAQLAGWSEHATRAMHVMATVGWADGVRELVRYGGDANCDDGEGMRPLHKASRFGRMDAAKALVDSGAAVTAQSGGGGATANDVTWERGNGGAATWRANGEAMDAMLCASGGVSTYPRGDAKAAACDGVATN